MALCGLVNITPSVMFHSMFRKRRKFKVFDSIVIMSIELVPSSNKGIMVASVTFFELVIIRSVIMIDSFGLTSTAVIVSIPLFVATAQ